MNTKQIEEALRLHCDYSGNFDGKYLNKMDRLAIGYGNTQGQALSKLLSEYYLIVGVKNLDEAFDRLHAIDKG